MSDRCPIVDRFVGFALGHDKATDTSAPPSAIKHDKAAPTHTPSAALGAEYACIVVRFALVPEWRRDQVASEPALGRETSPAPLAERHRCVMRKASEHRNHPPS